MGLAALMMMALQAVSADAACKIEIVNEIPVRLTANRMLVSATLNGQAADLLVDTGAPFTIIFPEGARKLHLPVRGTFDAIEGVGGASDTSIARIDNLRFGHVSLTKSTVLVAGRQDGPDEPIGLVGRDMFGDNDIEIDLAHGAIRLLRPKGCSASDMIYWGGSNYSEAPLATQDEVFPPFVTTVVLDGRPFQALIDSGAPQSVVTSAAAQSVGITPASSSSIPGNPVGGVGYGTMPSFSALFSSIGIGDEVIKDTRLRVADLFRYNIRPKLGTRLGEVQTDRIYGLLGLDFLHAHHVVISQSQHKLLFTYAGGPVFDTASRSAQARSSSAGTGPAPPDHAPSAH